MTLKKFELILIRLQVHGQKMYEEALRNILSGLSLEEMRKVKQPTYNQWERKMIMDAVKQIEF